MKRYRSPGILWLLFFLTITPAAGQTLHVQSSTFPFVETLWTVRDGLPIGRLAEVKLIQTRDGYLWMSTRDGLVRFDGLRFTVFTTDNTEGLPSNRISHILESRKGGLWFTTTFGQLVHYCNRTFKTIPYLDTYGSRAIFSIFESQDGTVWLGTDHGISRLVRGKLVPFRSDIIKGSVNHLLVDPNGDVWAATAREGLVHISGNRVERLNPPVSDAMAPVTAVYKSGDGKIWIQCGVNGSRIISYDRGRWGDLDSVPQAVSGNRLLHADRFGRLWLSDGTHLFEYRDNHWAAVQLPPVYRQLVDKTDAPGLAVTGELMNTPRPEAPGYSSGQNAGTQLLKDQEGNLWVASTTDGLYRYSPALVQTFSSFPNDPNLYAIFQSRDGSIWFGSLKGFLTQQLPDGRVFQYPPPQGIAAGAMAIFEDKDRNLWVGQSLCEREQDGRCSRFIPIKELAGTRVRAIKQDRIGQLWFGTENGLYRLIPGKGRHPLEGSWFRFSQTNGLSHNLVQVIAESSDGALWLGTNGGGLIRYQLDKFTPITTENGLSSNNVRAIYVDERGVLWIGTEDFGLNRLEPGTDKTGRFNIHRMKLTVVRERDGLYDNGIHSILEDASHRLWMSTNRGIFWIARNQLDAFADGKNNRVQATAYTSRDGLLDQEANGGSMHAGLESRDGRLWFATQVGAAVVNPRNIKSSGLPPTVAIEAVMAEHISQAITDEGLRLSKGQRDFEIYYTGISLSAPDRVQFRYRLEGFDNDWVDAGTRRTAFYTHVPPGKYTFRVLAASNDGLWTKEGATLTIVVPPFLYETTWFKVIAFLLVVGGLVLIYVIRHRQMAIREQELIRRVEQRTHELRVEKEKTEEQARKLVELDELKSQFFANISHEFRTPLTLIIGPLQQMISGAFGEIPAKARHHLTLMLRNSQRLLRLINQILDLSKVESGLLQLEAYPQDIVPLVDFAIRTFSPLAEKNEIALGYSVQYHRPDHKSCLVHYDREKFERVISNLLSNAIKFTPNGGSIQITVEEQAEYVELTVSDTGIGIAANKLPHIFDRFYQVDGSSRRSHQGSGIGLSIVKEFVELHRGTISVSSEPGKGTSFVIRLPIAQQQIALLLASGDGQSMIEAPEIEPNPMMGWMSVEADLMMHRDGVRSDGLHPDEDRTTLLVVDDNADVRHFIRSILEEEYVIVEAIDGQHGLEMARSIYPDLVIADIMMPRMDGLDLNRALKNDPDLSCIPVILLTAKASPEDQISGFDTDADLYVIKPFDPAVLAAQVRSLLSIRHRLRDRLSDRAETIRAEPVHIDEAVSSLERKARKLILDNLVNPDLNVEFIAAAVALSSSQLRRRFVEEVGLAPSAFIRQVRLEEAARLLKERAGNVSEIAFAVGFESLSHFTRSFRTQFGVNPSSYLESEPLPHS